MKKHLHNSLRALFLSLAVLLSMPMLAVEVMIDGINYDLNAETNQATVIAKSSGEYSGEVIIPESVEHDGTTYSVTSIGDNAFRNCSLTSVTIGNSVTSIGDNAFRNCSLTSVTIGNSVTSIGKRTFYECSGLTSVSIPNSVTSIGDEAFAYCSGLSSVTIGNSVTSIGAYAFSKCYALTSVTIPNSVTSIGDFAFWICSGLTSVTIGNSVTSIGAYAFNLCSGLTSVTIGNSVTSIGAYAFSNCSGLTSVTIPNSVTSIGGRAFANCPELHDVYCYAEEVLTTSSDAFESSSIASATLHVPAGSVDSYTATAPWSSFRPIVALPPFSGEVEIDGINYELNGETKQATVIAKSSGEYSGKVVIPESVEHEGTAYSVTRIVDNAFYECYHLTSVTIGNSVTSIGDNAFYWSLRLTSVHISDIAAWCNIDFITDYSNPLSYAHCLYLNGELVKDLVIPNSVTSIRDNAFYKCSALTSVTIPNSVTSIRDNAFYKCFALTSVTIPNSVTSIGSGAFSGCSGLTSVTIPNSVTSIGECAFAGCSKLHDVYCYAENVPSTESNAFEDSPIQNATLHVPVGSVESYKETEPWRGFENIVAIPPFSGEVEIDGINYELNGETNQATVIEKSSGEYSGEVVIPESVVYEGTTYSVTSIGDYAFNFCSGLTSVTIPNSVTRIGSGAFEGCSGLTSVTIGNSVESIGDFAFYFCSGLASVTIGNSVKSIGECAFYCFSELTDVYCYAENVPSTESNAFDGSYPGTATLHVPAVSVESYRTTEPWSGFETITPLIVEDLTLTDGEVFDNNIEQEVGTLTYTRTLPNMLWNPLYVPFKIPYEVLEENYEVAYINAMHSYDNDDNGEIDEMIMEVVKIKAGTLKPNHPYLIKAKNEEAMEMSIVQENATLYPAEITTLVCSSVYTKFEITGTYQEMTSEDLNGSLVISTDGAWKLLSSTSILKPFRFYLTISNLEGSPVEIAEEAMSSVRIRVMGESDNATGIDETENTENSVVFDLYGRRVSTPAKGGVYIINGKKVIY